MSLSQERIMNIGGGIIISLMLLVHIYIFWSSNRKINFIKSPRVGPTYCVLTVMIIRTLLVNILISMLCLFIRLTFICLGLNYQNMVLKNENLYWIYYTYQVLSMLLIYSTDIVYVSQIYEWMAMNNIIICQKDKLI